MDDTLGFSEQEKKSSDEWHPGDVEESVSSVTSKICPHYQDLQVLQKKQFFLDRPLIPATYWERLSYFRSYATIQTRTMFLCVQEEDFKVYLWNYLINVFFKSLPTTYVYAFFSAYVPDTHFFIAKIFPIAYGSTVAFIITALIDLIMVTFSTTKYLDYVVLGFRYQSPWNRSRIGYFQDSNMIQTCSYFAILWVGATITYTMLFKRFLWKSSDFDLLSESMTTPPLVHILHSRSNIDKKPIQDSAFIVTSNAIYYTFRGTLMEVIILFCLYPMGRLVDDITFFNGVRPTKLRIFSFWAAPFFYMIKFYYMITGLFKVVIMTTLIQKYPYLYQYIYIPVIPMFIGALFAFIKYVLVKKMILVKTANGDTVFDSKNKCGKAYFQGWIQLFKPLPNWGPKDYTLRQLRKRFDSRFYITSQASRELSRYLIEKSELNEYKLDVLYESLSRRPSLKPQINLETEKNQ
ncbi:uncharacterized protein LOC111000967 [Pieris rapae]|uniref:uncharacterized protein LOC111000967 n=1 Tax=Pieris rapae TaxID=64459 RepID=UPI001E27CEC4|nr:uncharacterized protein LOC111000967 [Pieris rapae]